MTFELRTETWADILAVLEAAQRWAEERTRVDDELDRTGMAMTGEMELRADALLALIDLGGTEMTFDEAKLQPPPMNKDDMFISGPVFGWDEASKQATVTFSIEKAGQVYQRVLVLSPVRVLGGTK